MHARKETLLSLFSLSQPGMWPQYLLQAVSSWFLTWRVSADYDVDQMMLFMTMIKHLEDHDQEKNRPWPRNYIHALFEIVAIEYQELFQQLLAAVLNSKEIQVFHYETCCYPTVLFDSPLSCLNLIYPHWLDTCKYSCFRWERMPHMGISHPLDRGLML